MQHASVPGILTVSLADALGQTATSDFHTRSTNRQTWCAVQKTSNTSDSGVNEQCPTVWMKMKNRKDWPEGRCVMKQEVYFVSSWICVHEARSQLPGIKILHENGARRLRALDGGVARERADRARLARPRAAVHRAAGAGADGVALYGGPRGARRDRRGGARAGGRGGAVARDGLVRDDCRARAVGADLDVGHLVRGVRVAGRAELLDGDEGPRGLAVERVRRPVRVGHSRERVLRWVLSDRVGRCNGMHAPRRRPS